MLTKEEFLESIELPKVSKPSPQLETCRSRLDSLLDVRYFEEMGIDPNEAEYLFTILDYDNSGCLDASEFVGGLLKVIGSAKAKDIMAVHCALRRSEKEGQRQISMLEQNIDRRMELLEIGAAFPCFFKPCWASSRSLEVLWPLFQSDLGRFDGLEA